jgi:hypothetical protein
LQDRSKKCFWNSLSKIYHSGSERWYCCIQFYLPDCFILRSQRGFGG